MALAGFIFLSIVTEAKTSPKHGSIKLPARVAKADLPSYAKIDFEAALHAAMAAEPGTIIEGELEKEHHNLVYCFLIVDAQRRLFEVEIDAGTGAVLSKEEEFEGRDGIDFGDDDDYDDDEED